MHWLTQFWKRSEGSSGHREMQTSSEPPGQLLLICNNTVNTTHAVVWCGVVTVVVVVGAGRGVVGLRVVVGAEPPGSVQPRQPI